MVKMTDQLVQLARAGASLDFPAGSKMTDQIIQVARALGPNATLRLRGCDAKMTDQLAQIAKAAPGKITLHFDG